MSNFPDVVVIGAQKSGTSTFYRNLVNCENLFFTKQKESNILINYHDKDGLSNAYKSSFVQDNFPRIDVSPKYSQRHLFDGPAKRLYKLNPNAKIVYVVRDPIDRLQSHLVHNLLRDRIQGNIKEELIINKDYLLTSSYHYQIKPYLELFPVNQFFVYQLENMIRDTRAFQEQLFGFLGVSQQVIPFKPYNVSTNRYIIKGHDWIHSRVSSKAILKLYHSFWWLINLKPSPVSISMETMNWIRNQLNEDIHDFTRIFNLKRELWKTFFISDKVKEPS